MSRLLQTLLFAVCMAILAVGCGGTSTGYVPVSSPLIQFQAPDADELLPDAEDEDEDEVDDEFDDEVDDNDAASDDSEEDSSAANLPKQPDTATK